MSCLSAYLSNFRKGTTSSLPGALLSHMPRCCFFRVYPFTDALKDSDKDFYS